MPDGGGIEQIAIEWELDAQRDVPERDIVQWRIARWRGEGAKPA